MHPADRQLLKPLSTLGKPKFSDSGVSFLRRTEYISSYTSKSRFESTTSRSLIGKTGSRNQRVALSLDKESPEYIKAQVEKSFEIAARNRTSNTVVRHPSKPGLKLVDSYAFLPDHHCFSDVGGFVSLKFLFNPVPPSSTYDKRLETSVLKPVEVSEEEAEAKEEAKEAHKRDPDRYPAPDETIDYEFFMAETQADAFNAKRKLDTLDPEKDDDELYTNQNADGQPCFRFKRLRAYESASITGYTQDKYEEQVLIALHDGSDGLRQKGAYYYPMVQKITVRPQRTKNIQSKRALYASQTAEDIKKQVDFLDIFIEDADEDSAAVREAFVANPFGKLDGEEEEAEQEAEVEARGSLTPEAS